MGKKINPSHITPERRKEMPQRGKGAKTLILDAMREKSLLGLKEGATRNEAEQAFFGFLAEAAFNPTEDTAAISNTCLNALAKKGWPDVKSTMPLVEFELTEGGTPLRQSNEIVSAIAKGLLPADIGLALISAMSSMLKIEEVTTIKEEMEEIKRKLGLDV